MYVVRKSALALIAVLGFSGLYPQVTGQDKSPDDGQWPSLVAGNRIIVAGGGPIFTVDERKLKRPPEVGNALDLGRCRPSETCHIHVTEFFSQWGGQHGIEKSLLRSDVLMHRYPRVWVNGHHRATGTYVFFLPKQSVFYAK